MKHYTTDQIRNVALVGHSGCGKTTLAEALLHYSGTIPKPGSVDAGSTVSDYDPEEIRRKVSINSTLLPIEAGDVKVNLLDCPGFRDFVGEIKNAIRVAELALVVVDAVTGVEVGTEFAHDFANEYHIPTAFFVNKMDKERADFERTMKGIDKAFGDVHTIPVVLPIGSEAGFKGVIDLLGMKAIYDEGGKAVEKEIPAEMKEEAELARRALIEAAAEGNDELTEKFLEQDALTDEEIILGLRQDLEAGRFCPVLCGSASKEIGLAVLMKFFKHECPPPTERKGFRGWKDRGKTEVELKKLDPHTDFSAYIYKTVNDEFVGRLSFFKVVTGEAKGDGSLKVVRTGSSSRVGHVFTFRGKTQIPVDSIATGDIGAFAKLEGARTGDTLAEPKGHEVEYEPTHLPRPNVQVAVEAKNKGDEDKLGSALHRLLETDPTLAIERDSMLHQTLMSGMGDTHLDVVHARVAAIAKIDFHMKPARVQYRETITKTAEGQGKYKKQTGGRGQYGDCWVRLQPNKAGAGFTFEWEVVGGVIPTNFTSSVEKGIHKALERGIVAGYPVIDIHAACYDGSYHAVDSSDAAFQVAASMAFKNVAAKCNPVLLEPINRVTIDVPDQYMGDVMGYVSGKRGRILGSEQLHHKMRVVADVPAAEMATFSRDMRSMTQGRSLFEAKFERYEAVPPAISDKVIAEVRIDHHEGE